MKLASLVMISLSLMVVHCGGTVSPTASEIEPDPAISKPCGWTDAIDLPTTGMSTCSAVAGYACQPYDAGSYWCWQCGNAPANWGDCDADVEVDAGACPWVAVDVGPADAPTVAMAQCSPVWDDGGWDQNSSSYPLPAGYSCIAQPSLDAGTFWCWQ